MAIEYENKIEVSPANVIILDPTKEILDATLLEQKKIIQVALLTPEE